MRKYLGDLPDNYMSIIITHRVGTVINVRKLFNPFLAKILEGYLLNMVQNKNW